jgi:cytochrome oxidase Cu insertion factor (SCO1/SenC/PrrC family)
LIGLALIFFGPLGVSFYLYYGHGSWHPGGRVNAGDLIVPPRPLPSLALPLQSSGETDSEFLRRKWTLLYVQQGACAERCRTSLYETRQVRLALDRDMDRVQRVFIADGDCCDFRLLHEQNPDLITVRMNPAAAPLLALLPHGGPDNAEHIFLIDPLGNLMMSYAPDAKPKGMLEDMKRLLRLSHIG